MDLQSLLIAIYSNGPFSIVFHECIQEDLTDQVEFDIHTIRRIMVATLYHCWVVLGWRPALDGVVIIEGGVHTHAATA